mmetsp:Transcript_571/g.1282  ORF Transcript_571/g.1282 Transcript_571/m.1282 type:complete len:230 (+) Transcript_571:90-779(+)
MYADGCVRLSVAACAHARRPQSASALCRGARRVRRASRVLSCRVGPRVAANITGRRRARGRGRAEAEVEAELRRARGKARRVGQPDERVVYNEEAVGAPQRAVGGARHGEGRRDGAGRALAQHGADGEQRATEHRDAHTRADAPDGHRGRFRRLRDGDRAARRRNASEAAVYGQHRWRVGRPVRSELLRIEPSHDQCGDVGEVDGRVALQEAVAHPDCTVGAHGGIRNG